MTKTAVQVVVRARHVDAPNMVPPALASWGIWKLPDELIDSGKQEPAQGSTASSVLVVAEYQYAVWLVGARHLEEELCRCKQFKVGVLCQWSR